MIQPEAHNPIPSTKLSIEQLDEVAGGGDVQLSPNVVNMFREVNEKGALQFDVPSWAARNLPPPAPPPAFYWPYNPKPTW